MASEVWVWSFPSFPRSGVVFVAGEVVKVFVGCASPCLLLRPAVAARGEVAGAWRFRFVGDGAGGLLRCLCSGRPWWRGERRLEAGVVGGPGRRCVGGMQGGAGEQELWPCPFIEPDSVARRRMDLAAVYNVWWRLLPGGKWYGDAGGI